MPELPEVETVKRGLAPVMEGREFSSVQLNRADIRFPFPENFIKRLEGVTLTRLGRRREIPRGGAIQRRDLAHAPWYEAGGLVSKLAHIIPVALRAPRLLCPQTAAIQTPSTIMWCLL